MNNVLFVGMVLIGILASFYTTTFFIKYLPPVKVEIIGGCKH